jgi:ferritin-like protein
VVDDEGRRWCGPAGPSFSLPPLRHSRALTGTGATSGERVLTRRAVVGASALAAGGAVLAGLPPIGASAPSAQDVRVLNFVLLLEYVESAFYAEARGRGRLRGELKQFAEIVGGHERQHVAFLRKALGAAARKPPKLDFGNATRDAKRFVAAAVALEDNNVAAYNGQATNLSPSVLAAAATIVSVEARHAAWIRDIAGERPAVDATDPVRSEASAIAAIRKLGFLA